MTTISPLIQDESAQLDHDQLGALYSQLGAIGAEDVVRRAMEELALRLSHLERQFRQNELKDVRKGAKSLGAIAEQIGMKKLVQVADDVCRTIDLGDDVAVAATLSRLMRVGERSLSALFDLQDTTI